MATLGEVHLEVQAARRLRPQTESLSLPVVDASGDGLGSRDFPYNGAGDANCGDRRRLQCAASPACQRTPNARHGPIRVVVLADGTMVVRDRPGMPMRTMRDRSGLNDAERTAWVDVDPI